jgi:hypothetical protein
VSTPEIYTEPWIYWLEAAAAHLERTRECRDISTSGLPIGPELVEATLAELPAAMQTIAAAAFAVDGFDAAVSDIVPLPKMGRPRARAIFRRLTSVLNLDSAVNPQHESDLLWLFQTRNEAVHSGVWKDVSWLHPSGLTVSQVQNEIGLESAERSLQVARDSSMPAFRQRMRTRFSVAGRLSAAGAARTFWVTGPGPRWVGREFAPASPTRFPHQRPISQGPRVRRGRLNRDPGLSA